MTSTQIATIDLIEFREGNQQQRQDIANKLGQAYSDIGFAAITGHHLDPNLADRLYEQVQQFFLLPEKTKKKYHEPGIFGQRGYMPLGIEQAIDSNTPDLKEFWHHGPNYSLEFIAVKGEAALKNIVCKEAPEFTRTLTQAHRALQRSGEEVLDMIALYLGLNEGYFNPKVRDGESLLRAIHYPPITQDPGNALRAAAHEDINLITLLMGASAQGLELLDRQGQWRAVQPEPDQLVVNVGDMLQRLTNKRLISTTHRVVNPPKDQWDQPRFSLPFFLHPRSEVSLACLDSCISADNPKQFDDMSAGAYLQERLDAIRVSKKSK